MNGWAQAVRHNRPQPTAQPLTTLQRTVLAEVYKAGGIVAREELIEAVDMPDASSCIDGMRLYLRPVRLRSDRPGGTASGLVLTLAGADLARQALAGDFLEVL
jgi:hypothetical protein